MATTLSRHICRVRNVPRAISRRVDYLTYRSSRNFSHLTCRLQQTVVNDANLPRLIQPSTWHSIIPRGLWRKTEQRTARASKKSSNPASYFIWIYLLIGSQAIRILQKQNDFKTFSRKADLKIDKLREVIEKLQKGEAVDVEKALGTGDEIQELEWEEALREIENEDRVWQTNKKSRREQKENKSREDEDANPINTAADDVHDMEKSQPNAQPSVPSPPGFY